MNGLLVGIDGLVRLPDPDVRTPRLLYHDAISLLGCSFVQFRKCETITGQSLMLSSSVGEVSGPVNFLPVRSYSVALHLSTNPPMPCTLCPFQPLFVLDA